MLRAFGAGRHLFSVDLLKAGKAPISSQDRPSLKAHLRELYKRVHPDRFHDYPPARETNERSFKLLQEYLASARQGGELGRTAGVPYRFNFYLRQLEGAKSVESVGRGAVVETEGDLQKVSLTLPPPGRLGASYPGSDQLPPSTEKALGKLLAACGLENDFSGAVDGSFAFSQHQNLTGARLRDFVPEAAELLRQNEVAQFGSRQQLSAARTALRIGRQVRAEFTDEARQLGTAERADLLQRLAAALDRVPGNVKGIHVLLGNGYGLDSLGRVRLHHTDNALMWSGFLMQLDLDACRSRQEAVAAVRHLEASVAALLGVPLIYTALQLSVEDRYRHFLERLAERGQAHGMIFGRPVSDVPLQVVPGGESCGSGDSSTSGSSFEVDQDRGVLCVPVDASAQAVYEFCQKQGLALQRQQARKQQSASTLDILRGRAERQLRLRKLQLDSTVSQERQRACLLRLLQATDTLRGLLDGLSIRVSHINHVASDSGHIDIAWDFEV